MDNKLKGILSEQQFTRWKQIQLQAQGPAVFGRPDVSQKLGLTEEQHDELRAIHQEMMGQMRPPQPGGNFDPQEHHKKMQALHDKLYQRVLGILTSEQRSKWNAMIGKPFKFEFRPPQRRGE